MKNHENCKNYIISYYISNISNIPDISNRKKGNAAFAEATRIDGKLVISAESYTGAYLAAVFSLPTRSVITDVCEY